MKRSLVGAVTAAAVACASVGALLWSGDDDTVLAVPDPEPTAVSTAFVGRAAPRASVTFDEQASGLPFDPFSAPTPEVAQGQTPAVVPLPTAPSTIHTAAVEKVGTAKADALLSMPLSGRKTSRFGLRFHPVLHVWELHTGLDLAASCGTAVGAAADGKVVRTGWAGGNGIQVKIDHGMLGTHRVVTTYNHLSSIGVKVGQKVEALDGIGRVGSTGYSTGCHLHFEVIVDGQFTDPEPWLDGKPIVVDLTKMIAELPSATPSPSPTDSPTPEESPSPEGSPSAEESPSPDGSPSPEESASPDGPASPDGSASPSGSPSPSGSAGPSPSPSPSNSGTPTKPGTPSGSPSGSPSPSPSPSASPSPSPSPSASPSPSPSPSPSETEPFASEAEEEPEGEASDLKTASASASEKEPGPSDTGSASRSGDPSEESSPG
jgi:murein DD-endopeptidase MepM/ murein hydrolase activator NlpD